MRFEEPRYLVAMAVLMPLLLAFLVWAWRVRQRLITQFVQSRLLAVLTVGVSKPRQKFRLACVFAATLLLFLALARPQWGFGFEEVKQRGLDIIVAIDTSRSMLAEDVAPNRLARTKLAAIDLRRLAKADRMGLIAFAGSAFLQMPLSVDDDAFRQHLEALDTGIIPQGGSAVGEAIQTARSAFKDGRQDNFRVLILMTDGEDHEGQAIDIARKASEDGMHIFTVGVGTPSGELLSVRDTKGRIEFVKDDQGNVVKSRLNETLLQEIASAGQGFYLPLTGTGAMETLYDRGLAPLPKGEIQAQVLKRYFERFQWFIGAALIFLMMEWLVTDRKTAPRREGGTLRSPSAAAGTLPTTALLLGLLLSLTLAPQHSALAASPSLRSAQEHYNSGRYKNALNDYESLLEKKSDDARIQYNAGNAAFKAGKFDGAIQHFSSALATSDPTLQQQAYFNRGNSRFRAGESAGDPSATEPLWQQAAADYESALKLQPNDEDAKHNLQVVKERLEELQKQKPPSDSKDNKNQDKDKDKDKEKDQKQDQDKDQNQNDKKDQDKDSKQNEQDKQQQQQQQQQDKDSKDSKSGKEQNPNKDEKDQDSKEKQDEKSKQEQKQDNKGQDPKKPGEAAKQGQQGKDGQNAADGTPGQILQMTPQQAIQMLEALKSEERLLPPQIQNTNRHRRVLKDW